MVYSASLVIVIKSVLPAKNVNGLAFASVTYRLQEKNAQYVTVSLNLTKLHVWMFWKERMVLATATAEDSKRNKLPKINAPWILIAMECRTE